MASISGLPGLALKSPATTTAWLLVIQPDVMLAMRAVCLARTPSVSLDTRWAEQMWRIGLAPYFTQGELRIAGAVLVDLPKLFFVLFG